MKLWHKTVDAPCVPENVSAGQIVELWMGTYPIEPGQHIKVEWKVTRVDGSSEHGNLPAIWRYNEFALGSSYWLATIGPIQRDDLVEYKIAGVWRLNSWSRNILIQCRITEGDTLMTRDPVCGMTIEAEAAAGRSLHLGTLYHFCAPVCKKMFDAAPEKCVEKP